MIGEKSLPVLLLSDWFALLDVGLVIAAGALWYAFPQLGPLPLVLALAPWVMRLAVRRAPFVRTPLDLVFLLFLATALVGVWAAYDRGRALAKFWLVLDGVLLFYALAAQPRNNLWRIARGAGLAAFGLSIYFFLTHDWEVSPAKIEALNNIGLALMSFRPTLPAHILHPNVAAGMTAMFTPFLVAVFVREIQEERRTAAVLAGIALGIVAFSLLMTTSRGAWIALSAALLFWGMWALSGVMARVTTVGRMSNFLTFLVIVLIAGGFVVFTTEGGLVGLANQLPGPSHTGSRLDLISGVSYLIADFPITGGGLDSFPGLFAQYILVSPFYIVEHGHNLFLDMTLEQGFLGGFALVLLIGITMWKLLPAYFSDEGEFQPVLAAAIAGLIVMTLHGLADDVLYGSRAALLLWVTAGIGFSARPADPDDEPVPADPRIWAMAGVVLVVAVIYGFIFRDALGVVWSTNMAAVQMARIDLAEFPSGEWDDGSEAAELTPPAAIFESTVRRDPDNQTARYRLGLIGMLTRNFDVAREHLEAAYRAAPGHPGIVKSLAYAYAWSGQTEQALSLLREVEDAGTEMRNYAGWWRTQGREDLAVIAESLTVLLGGNRQ